MLPGPHKISIPVIFQKEKGRDAKNEIDIFSMLYYNRMDVKCPGGTGH
jgi:hypothetical protein